MLSLLLLVIFALGVAYFATQNTGLSHILLGGYLLKDIPVYVIVIASLLLGIFVSWLLSIADKFSTYFTIHGKESEIKRMQKEINDLRHENRVLEAENSRLQEKVETVRSLEEKGERPSFSRMGHAFNFH
ncbi:MAG TPA: lipopolysaccharide assembly protein LapA domain-containing protein [Candidatus Eisenbacteria bacterium]|nr:lipopolysaccharide assembly protein LapA domain-containing protein [Candidatus Eisenbacteria bacterium]